MNKNRLTGMVVIVAAFAVGMFAGTAFTDANIAVAQSTDRVFELRTYTALPGRLDALHARFRDHTLRLFEKHGMTNIVYFSPRDEPLSENTLIYVISHDSREAARSNWQSFIADPEWQRVSEESQRDGRLIESLESIFMDPTDYSPMR